jgi:hypothetical protein
MSIRTDVERLERAVAAMVSRPKDEPLLSLSFEELRQLPAEELVALYRRTLPRDRPAAATAFEEEFRRLRQLPAEELARLYRECVGEPRERNEQ